MTDFRAKRAPSIPGRSIHPVANAKPVPLSGREKRRGVRVNSRVPIAVEWGTGADLVRKETQTRVVRANVWMHGGPSRRIWKSRRPSV